MKKILIIVVLLGVFACMPAFAQVNTEDQIEVLRDSAEVDRKAIVAMNVNLTEEESAVFWPVYNKYRGEMKDVNDRLLAMIRKYAENFKNLSDEMAAELMAEAMDIEQDRQIYKRLYVEGLLDILPTKKVAVLFQIENKIEAEIKYDLSLEIPFVNDAKQPSAETSGKAEAQK
jgi:hypothetical protein